MTMNRILALSLATLLTAACSKELVCPTGQSVCSGRCVSLQTDPDNCGACGATVGPLGACVSGLSVCQDGIDTCGSTCTDLARDPLNCGGCDVKCSDLQLCDSSSSSCVAACPTGYDACGRTCADLQSDRFHCGACGAACPVGQQCLAGACRPDLVVACYATNELQPATAALALAGPPLATAGGPTAIAVKDGVAFSADGWPAAVDVLPLTGAGAVQTSLAGNDLQEIVLHGGALLVANAGTGSLVFLSEAGVVLNELALPGQTLSPLPKGIAVLGDVAWVALPGTGDAGSGQALAKVDVSGIAACLANPAIPCGVAAGSIDLLAVPGTHNDPGLPFPSDVVAAGGKLYVSLNNRQWGTAGGWSGWLKPAGNGKLAIVDPAASDAVVAVDLGPSCGNAGPLALEGTTLWVGCGSFGFPDFAPGVLLPVDLSQDPPVPGTAIDVSPVIPGKLAFCGGVGYATDQGSGAVLRFDPVAGTAEAPVTVCPMSNWGYASASDIACGH